MSREVHVRLSDGLGVKLLGATHPTRRLTSELVIERCGLGESFSHRLDIYIDS